MNVTLHKGSPKFPAIHYNENKVRASKKAGLTGKDSRAELVGVRNFPFDDAGFLSANAKEQFMLDWCAKSRVNVRQMHFTVSCRRHEKTEDELKAAAEHLLNELGYARCPALFYIHRDTDNLHLHVVTTKCDENGLKIHDWHSARRMRECLDKHENRDVANDVQRAVRLAFSYHFTHDRHFISLLASMGYQARREAEPPDQAPNLPPDKKGQDKSSNFPDILLLFRNRKMVGEVSMDEIKTLMEANRKKAMAEADFQRAKQLSAIMHDYRKREASDFYIGRRPTTKLELVIDQEVVAVDRIHNDRMAERGIMRNDLYQMALFQRDMKKGFGIDVVYNYDRTGVPNGFIVLDHQAKRVWRGSELGFRFKEFLRPDEKALLKFIDDERCSEALKLKDKAMDEGFKGAAAVEVRLPQGGTGFLFYGRFNIALLPDKLGKNYEYKGIPIRCLNHEEIALLKNLGVEVRVDKTMYDSIPFVIPTPKDESPSLVADRDNEQEMGDTHLSQTIIEHVGNVVSTAAGALAETAEVVAETAEDIAETVVDSSLNAIMGVLATPTDGNIGASSGKAKDLSKKKNTKYHRR